MQLFDLQPYAPFHRAARPLEHCPIPLAAGLPAITPAADSAIPLADHLADLAVEALIDEADLSPKPGLVDRRSSGVHSDMTLAMMHASALALWPCLRQMAGAAQAHGEVGPALRIELGRIGREGEAAMLATTCGVNTHRGAIWALGLLVAAQALDATADASTVAARAGRIALIEDPAAATHDSHGTQVRRRYGAGGAREQAQQGFPAIIGHGLPQLRRSRANGASENHARLDALLAIMAALSDTCVLWRAGPQGLQTLQQGARHVLAAGGSATLDGRRLLRLLDTQLLQLNASPGGAADLLAACLFLDKAGSL
ncbi:triphosphoribosyl-dephospho-CoA synthase [Pseudomonas putida]|uniref:triphosphoribosyl-dephospho-CoA synthase n=1 Tax=Pseudomonas putida TaxID=303 RepID=UPI00226DA67E|nr:triphosphoribosyl-dephospho-CoA synthase [Pseudomonas putida]WAB95872.1 triphosphoribosyl-dephospho-CoA synthase [Pseudomonas putida]